MLRDDKELLGCGAGCIVAGLLAFAGMVLTVAAAIKWVMS